MDKIEKVDIFVDPEVRKLLVEFLLTDWLGTGQGYSDFIRKSIVLWRSPASYEDTDKCTWQYDLVSKGWVAGCGHRQRRRPKNPVCPYCVKPLLIGALSAHQWTKEEDKENGRENQE